MHALSTNQIADILDFTDNVYYLLICMVDIAY